MEAAPGQITLLLKDLSLGNKEAGNRLMPLVYRELRSLALHYMRMERTGHTLQPTALVHEAYIRLVDQTVADWKDRSHFFAVAAQAMRHVLVDHARGQKAVKRGGPAQQRVPLEPDLAFSEDRTMEVLAVDELLTRLAEFAPRQCLIVELRFFAGLSEEETAEVLHSSPRTVRREWKMAKAWLYGQLAQTGANATAT